MPGTPSIDLRLRLAYAGSRRHSARRASPPRTRSPPSTRTSLPSCSTSPYVPHSRIPFSASPSCGGSVPIDALLLLLLDREQQQLHTSQATHQRLTTELWSNVNSCLGQIDHCSHLLQDNDLLQMRVRLLSHASIHSSNDNRPLTIHRCCCRRWVQELYSKQAASKGVFEFSSLPSETNRATHAAAPSTGGGGGGGQTLRSMTVPVEPFHACGRASQPLNVHATTNAPATASTLAIDSPDSMIQILTTANISRKLEVRWQRDVRLLSYMPASS